MLGRRTTIVIAPELLAAIDAVVDRGEARSRNEFVNAALQREMKARRRAQIDAAFLAAADDQEYLDEAAAIAEEFVAAEWEALLEYEAGDTDASR